MKKISVSTTQMQELDRFAIDQVGISSLALMETAGRHVAEAIIARVEGKAQARVVIACGMGNNAGDGFVAARHLLNQDLDLQVVCLGGIQQLKADAALNYAILEKCGVNIEIVNLSTVSFIDDLKNADVVCDALFGVGLNRNIGEPYISVVNLINQHARYVISVDVPSGLDATSGEIYGSCIKADVTVTFSYPKVGFLKAMGPQLVGEVNVVDIGIPQSLLKHVL